MFYLRTAALFLFLLAPSGSLFAQTTIQEKPAVLIGSFSSEIENFAIALPAADARAKRLENLSRPGDARSDSTVVTWPGQQAGYAVTHVRFRDISFAIKRNRDEYCRAIVNGYLETPEAFVSEQRSVKIGGLDGIEAVVTNSNAKQLLVRVMAYGRESFILIAHVYRANSPQILAEARQVFDTFRFVKPLPFVKDEPLSPSATFSDKTLTVGTIKRDPSITSTESLTDQDIFSSAEAGFSIRLHKDAAKLIQPGMYEWSYENEKVRAGVYVHDSDFDEKTRGLALADTKAGLRGIGEVQSEREFNQDGSTINEAVVAGPNGERAILRVIFIGKKMYSAIGSYEADDRLAEKAMLRVLNSFRPLP